MGSPSKRTVFIFICLSIGICSLIWTVTVSKERLEETRAQLMPFSEFTNTLSYSNPNLIRKVTFMNDGNGNVYRVLIRRFGEGAVAADVPTKQDLDKVHELVLEKKFDYEAVTRPQNFMMQAFVGALIPLALLAVMLFFTRFYRTGGLTMMNKFVKSAAVRVERTGLPTFEDVAGNIDAKAELQDIVLQLKNPGLYRSFGGRLQKGVLLVGPPGTGKTLLARAMAGEASVPFFSISGSEFVEMFVGVGAARVRDLFEQATKEGGPAIIFIDELDAVGRHRGTGLGGGHDEREQTLNQLLVEMDGMTPRGVIIIAATNRPDILDPALLRPGRFDRQVKVERPDRLARLAILKVRIRIQKVPVADDVDLEKLSFMTPGFTGADLDNLVNRACLLAARESVSSTNQQRKDGVTWREIRNTEAAPVVSWIHFDDAFQILVAGDAKDLSVYSDEELDNTSAHEAGHLAVGFLMDPLYRLMRATIVPRGDSGGHTQGGSAREKAMQTREDLLAQIMLLHGGAAAQEVLYQRIDTGAHDDFLRATDLARQMVTELGMFRKLAPFAMRGHAAQPFLGMDLAARNDFGPQLANQTDEEVMRTLKHCYEQTVALLQQNLAFLRAVAAELRRNETLREEVFLSIARQFGLKAGQSRHLLEAPSVPAN